MDLGLNNAPANNQRCPNCDHDPDQDATPEQAHARLDYALRTAGHDPSRALQALDAAPFCVIFVAGLATGLLVSPATSMLRTAPTIVFKVRATTASHPASGAVNWQHSAIMVECASA